MAFRKNRASEQQTAPAPEQPIKAGAPTVTVRKQWNIGSLQITAEDGRVRVDRMRSLVPGGCRLPSLHEGLALSASECAALADALLQAAP